MFYLVSLFYIVHNISKTDLITDFKKLSAKSYFIYQQYLKINASSASFKNYFATDGLKHINAITNDFKINSSCCKCKKSLNDEKAKFKICSKCFSFFHYVCLNEDTVSNKIWICSNCNKA